MSADKEKLIVKLTNTREQLNAALKRVTPQEEIYPAWKVKQLLDHLTGWDELVASAFHAHSQGDTLGIKVKHGIDQFNAASVDERKKFTLEQSRQAYESAREAVLQALRDMPDDKLEQRFPAPWGGMCSVASVVKILVSHEQEHARQIEEKLGKPGE